MEPHRSPNDQRENGEHDASWVSVHTSPRRRTPPDAEEHVASSLVAVAVPHGNGSALEVARRLESQSPQVSPQRGVVSIVPTAMVQRAAQDLLSRVSSVRSLAAVQSALRMETIGRQSLGCEERAECCILELCAEELWCRAKLFHEEKAEWREIGVAAAESGQHTRATMARATQLVEEENRKRSEIAFAWNVMSTQLFVPAARWIQTQREACALVTAEARNRQSIIVERVSCLLATACSQETEMRGVMVRLDRVDFSLPQLALPCFCPSRSQALLLLPLLSSREGTDDNATYFTSFASVASESMERNSYDFRVCSHERSVPVSSAGHYVTFVLPFLKLLSRETAHRMAISQEQERAAPTSSKFRCKEGAPLQPAEVLAVQQMFSSQPKAAPKGAGLSRNSALSREFVVGLMNLDRLEWASRSWVVAIEAMHRHWVSTRRQVAAQEQSTWQSMLNARAQVVLQFSTFIPPKSQNVPKPTRTQAKVPARTAATTANSTPPRDSEVRENSRNRKAGESAAATQRPSSSTEVTSARSKPALGKSSSGTTSATSPHTRPPFVLSPKRFDTTQRFAASRTRDVDEQDVAASDTVVGSHGHRKPPIPSFSPKRQEKSQHESSGRADSSEAFLFELADVQQQRAVLLPHVAAVLRLRGVCNDLRKIRECFQEALVAQRRRRDTVSRDLGGEALDAHSFSMMMQLISRGTAPIWPVTESNVRTNHIDAAASHSHADLGQSSFPPTVEVAMSPLPTTTQRASQSTRHSSPRTPRDSNEYPVPHSTQDMAPQSSSFNMQESVDGPPQTASAALAGATSTRKHAQAAALFRRAVRASNPKLPVALAMEERISFDDVASVLSLSAPTPDERLIAAYRQALAGDANGTDGARDGAPFDAVELHAKKMSFGQFLAFLSITS